MVRSYTTTKVRFLDCNYLQEIPGTTHLIPDYTAACRGTLPPTLPSSATQNEPEAVIRVNLSVHHFHPLFWLELDTLGFSRAQFGTHPGLFEGIPVIFPRGLNLRKCLCDAGFFANCR